MSLTCRDIITIAYRKLGEVGSGDTPSSEEAADGFSALNNMVRALHGTVIGPRLSPQPFTATGQAENGGLYQCALSAATAIVAPLNPNGGTRFGVADVGLNFAANNLTINRNARLFEGVAANLVLNANGAQRVWFFDPDTGNWVREQDLASLDVSPPYPDRLVDLLPDMLAVFVAPQFDAEITPALAGAATLAMRAFAGNYGRRGRNQIDSGGSLGALASAQGG